MLNLRRTFLIAFTLLFIDTLVTLQAAAQQDLQNGYIVHAPTDTLQGQIDYREWVANPRVITFLDGRTGKKAEYGPGDISAFFVSGETYRSFRVHVVPVTGGISETVEEAEFAEKPFDTVCFLRLVTGGRLSLYSYQDRTGKSVFFVQRDGQAPAELESTVVITDVDGSRTLQAREEYKYMLARLTAECPNMMTSKMDVAYTEAALRKKVVAYNHCGGDATVSDSIPYADRHDQARWYISPLIGFAHSTVHVSGTSSYMPQERWPAANAVTGGLGVLYVLPRGRGQYSLVMNALFQHFQSAGSTLNEAYGLTVQGEFKYSQIQTSLLFRYRYPGGRVRPFINGGIGEVAIFGNKSTQTIGTEQQGLFGDPSYMHSSQTALVGGLGVEISRFVVEVRGSRTDNFADITGTGADMTHLLVLAGFNF